MDFVTFLMQSRNLECFCWNPSAAAGFLGHQQSEMACLVFDCRPQIVAKGQVSEAFFIGLTKGNEA